MSMIKKLFLKNFIVNLLAVLSATLSWIIDSAVTTNMINSDYASIFSITLTLSAFLEGFATVISTGAQTLSGNAISKGNRQKTIEIFSTICMVTLIFSSLIILLLYLFTPQMISLMGFVSDDMTVINSAGEYIHGYAFAVPAIVGMTVLMPFVQIDSGSVRCWVAVAVSIISNVIIDILTIKVFNLGMFGIGMATTISYWLACFILFVHFLKKESYIKFSIQSFNIKEALSIFKIGFPAIIDRICAMIREPLRTSLTLRFCNISVLSASNVANNIDSVAESACKSIGRSVHSLTSVYGNRSDSKLREDIVKTGFKYSFIVSGSCTLLICIFAKQIVSLFIPQDFEYFDFAVKMTQILSTAEVFYSLTLTYINYTHAQKRMLISYILKITDGLSQIIVLALAPYIFSDPKMGIAGFFTISKIFLTLIILLYIWVSNKKITFNIKDLLLIPSDCIIPEKCKYNYVYEFNSRTDAVELTNTISHISSQIYDICYKNNIDKKTAYHTSLCVEELLNTIVANGSDSSKTNSIFISAVVKDSKLKIYVEDNCRPFNPKKWKDFFDSEDPCSCIGIRITEKMSERFEYINLFGCNSMLIEL